MHVSAHDKAERDPIINAFAAIPIKGTNRTKRHENVVGTGDCGSKLCIGMDTIAILAQRMKATSLAMDTASKQAVHNRFDAIVTHVVSPKPDQPFTNLSH